MPKKFPDTPEGRAAAVEYHRACNRKSYEKRKAARPPRVSKSVDKAAYQREYRARNREWFQNMERQRKFGLTPEEYEKMLEAQGNKCAICGGEETATRLEKTKSLAVDHDHKTGKIRGLLCCECNQGLGKFKDSRDMLLSAAKYLDGHSNGSVVEVALLKGVK